MPVKINEMMQRVLSLAFSDGVPPLVGTVMQDGRPQISPKGTLAVYDSEHLCFWERSFRTSYGALSDNPKVVVYYRNQARAQEMGIRNGALRFHGIARLAEPGSERDRIWDLSPAAEQQRDPEKKGVGFIIRVDVIEDLAGQVIMQRE
jgi:hypothetical protein